MCATRTEPDWFGTTVAAGMTTSALREISGSSAVPTSAPSGLTGYTIINVKSRAEAVEWTRKFPNPTLDGSDCEIEVRQMFELEDFGHEETLDRFRDLDMGAAGVKARP